ncbi:MAG: type III polyketide synthase [Candidatus Hydrogenedentes bacterium]|nr:type III polyketide synthase [Candidatus Hydrogenedentota bacterium]
MGTALPAHSIGIDESLVYAAKAFEASGEQERQLKLLYKMTGVQRRHTCVLNAPEGEPNRQPFFPDPNGTMRQGPTIRARMEKYENDSLPLALEASRKALEESNIEPLAITHLVTISCSGFAAPGVDIGLIKGLGLPFTCQRTHVGFMGCHGALNGLRVARGFIESDPNARVLLCAVELCSLHYHYGWNPEQIVANALFADGSAAIVATAANDTEGAWTIANTGSCLVPESEDAMTWRIGNNGFIMSLSSRVPELIGSHLRPWMEGWLQQNKLTLGDIRSWAVHPGGPRILGSVVKALNLAKDAVDISREVLRDHGNMSSPTILFILNRLREASAPRPCVALGFGPGLMAEATLFV